MTVVGFQDQAGIHEIEQHYAQGPDVGLRTASLTPVVLWGHVPFCPPGGCICARDHRHVEVDDFGLRERARALVRDHDVPWLDIAMGDVVLVEPADVRQ